MKILQLLIIFCIFFILITISPSEAGGLSDLYNKVKSLFKKGKQKVKNKINEHFNPLKFLSKYGYGLGIKTRQNVLASNYKNSEIKLGKNRDFSDMISLFQSLFGLKVTGKLDVKTIEQMMAPRCGFPDILDADDNHQPITKSPNLRGGPAAYVAGGTKWQKTALTYKFLNYNVELGKEGTRFAIDKAFNYWAKHAEINFKEVSQNSLADFVIEFSQGDHGDGYPFDGSSGVLAHAFFPNSGKVHFDEAEHFTENTKEGVNLRLVAAHEIGHALGLDHSYTKGALMYPYYAGYVPLDEFDLDQDDILGIRSIYGHRKTPIETTSPARTTKKMTEKTRQTKRPTTRHKTLRTTKRPIYGSETSPCDTKRHEIEAAFTSPQNNIFILIKHDELWEYNVRRKSWRKHNLLRKYPGLESGVRGGVKCKNGLTWFFKDRRVWAFKGFKLMESYPKKIKDRLYPSNPYTVSMIGGKMYVIKGSFAYRFDTRTLKTDGKFPKHVRTVFKGVPTWIEASLEYRSEHYMFKGEMVYKLKGKKGHEKVIKGYPRKINKAWLPCFKR